MVLFVSRRNRLTRLANLTGLSIQAVLPGKVRPYLLLSAGIELNCHAEKPRFQK